MIEQRIGMDERDKQFEMSQFVIRYPQQKNSLLHNMFYYLNLVAIFADILFYFYLMVSFNEPFETWRSIGAIHAFLLAPSVLYHLFPFIRRNLLFKVLTNFVSSLVILSLIISVGEFMNNEDQLAQFIFLFVMIFVTFPGGVLSLSLLLVINSSEEKPKYTYLLSQDDKMYQTFMAI
uniref:Uncharacterized protein n=1 Tax=Euplotes crassus TaxID=5936 RepID=A0A7S3KUQ1_EUPCR|mmetsp:Transcript_5563/g.5285  ORF Transcript_5563/g.5285 Transcript_5563/m.5285 type:complete len:177 (+) Transcript_5563:16-546(+)